MSSSMVKQVGGSHYKKYKIQPVEYAMANNLNYCQANAIKYITRYKDKGGIEDLHKAIHNLEILIELEEKEDTWAKKEAEKEEPYLLSVDQIVVPPAGYTGQEIEEFEYEKIL